MPDVLQPLRQRLDDAHTDAVLFGLGNEQRNGGITGFADQARATYRRGKCQSHRLDQCFGQIVGRGGIKIVNALLKHRTIDGMRGHLQIQGTHTGLLQHGKILAANVDGAHRVFTQEEWQEGIEIGRELLHDLRKMRTASLKQHDTRGIGQQVFENLRRRQRTGRWYR